MATTTKKQPKQTVQIFTPSVNIIRDAEQRLTYIPTPNARQAFNQIVSGYLQGTRSFNLVGAYGTGKSAFLLAFLQNINKQKAHFGTVKNQFGDIAKFEVVSFVGEYHSFTKTVAQVFGLAYKPGIKNSDVIKQVDSFYKKTVKQCNGLVIMVDEFGKYLEYAAQNNPESELYFIQQLAEYANDAGKNIIFITTLHQDFNGYARSLTQNQRNEWDKVKGRLKEITFNEPVEQLLYLASERIESLKFDNADKNADRIYKAIEQSKAFPLRDYFNKTVARKLLPFDILSAAVLTLALQKYGQNERSLFSFIESDDYLGLSRVIAERKPWYHLASVYDYLSFHYYSILNTSINAEKAQWAGLRNAIERCEGVLDREIPEALLLVKTIGLLNLFAPASASIDETFLNEYGKFCLGIKNPVAILKTLQKHKIIRYVKFSRKFILFEGTDLDIELAIDEAGNLVEKVTNVVSRLEAYFDFRFLPAKAAFYEKGTPRFFQFYLSDEPKSNLIPRNETDGYINLVFSEKINETSIRKASENTREAILIGWYKNTGEIARELREIAKVEKVLELHYEDRVAKRELERILEHHIKLLNHYVNGSLYNHGSDIVWYFMGQRQRVNSHQEFNRLLSNICNTVYDRTPVFKNELVNKTSYHSVISKARRELIQRLINHSHSPYLGYSSSEFPPDKTIYLSLLKETGIHSESPDGWVLGEPRTLGFMAIWELSMDFIGSTRLGRRSVKDLLDLLSNRPFKLKQGLIDFWVPVFLLVVKEEYALFGRDGFIHTLTADTMDLVVRNPEHYEIKAFEIDGVKLDLFNKYRSLLNQRKQESPNKKSFIETIKPFLSFYKDLTPFARQTKMVNAATQKFRQTIAQSKDPEKTFFEDFPNAFGYTMAALRKNPKDLETYVQRLQASVKELRGCYSELLDWLEHIIQNEIVGGKMLFEGYKSLLQQRYKNLKTHFLNETQQKLVSQLNSPLDDRNSWLNAVAQACTGKRLDHFTDADKHILYDRLKSLIHQLDNLSELSNQVIDDSREEVIQLEIASLVENINRSIIRLPKTKNKEIEKLAEALKKKLGNDRQVNIAILVKLLQKEMASGY
jgi:hypothetical protein